MEKQVVMQPTIPATRVFEELGKIHVQLEEARRVIDEQAKTIQALREQIAETLRQSEAADTAAD